MLGTLCAGRPRSRPAEPAWRSAPQRRTEQLPMRERPIRPLINPRHTRSCNFPDHLQLAHIRSYSEPGPVVRIELAQLEIKTLGQMWDGLVHVVVFEDHWP